MIPRYLPLVLAAVATTACSRSRSGQGAGDSAVARTTRADSSAPSSSEAGEGSTIPESAATTASPESAVSAHTRAAPRADSESGQARTHRDSLVESRRHLPKGAKTDTGFRPRAVAPRDSGAGHDST